ncbi:hypothetical protein, partial [Klebsiella pneumoniae]|uniref:hypothetical protein n=1 Tax=Klebsiella pneumoniae TaxID=573 RepID=UPI00301357CA
TDRPNLNWIFLAESRTALKVHPPHSFPDRLLCATLAAKDDRISKAAVGDVPAKYQFCRVE